MTAPIQYANDINAKIAIWGLDHSGKSSNLRFIYQKLRQDHRGEIKSMNFGQADYEIFPIELGQIQGLKTNFQIYALPGQRDAVLARQQLALESFGIILIIDSDAARLNENVGLVQELQKLFQLCGVHPGHFPGVIQYNKRDLPSGLSIEDLQGKLNLFGWPFFEATAHHGLGILQTLTTVSKSVIRYIKGSGKALRMQTLTEDDLGLSQAPSVITPAAHSPNPPPMIVPTAKMGAAIGSELSLIRVEPNAQASHGNAGVYETILTLRDAKSGKEFFSKIKIKPRLSTDGLTLKFVTEKD